MDNKKRLSYLLIFLINPFLSLYFALRKKADKVVIVTLITLICGYWGYSIVIPGPSHDLAAQARFFIEDQYRYNSVIEIIATYGETNLDIVRPVINYTVSLYTGNVYVLFMIYGLLFGIVFSNNVYYLIKLYNNHSRDKILYLYLIFVFVLIIPPWQGIGNLRFWIASQLFIYSIICIIDGRRLKGDIIIVSTILIHFSFIFIVPFVFLYRFVGNRQVIFFYIYFASLLLTSIDYELLRSFISAYLPDIFEKKSEGYLDENRFEAIQRNRSSLAVYIRYQFIALEIGSLLLMISLFLRKINNIIDTKNSDIRNAINILLSLGLLSNIASLIPSGHRFQMVFYCVLIVSFIYINTYHKITGNNKSYIYNKYLIIISSFMFFIYSIVSIRVMLGVTEGTFFIGNFIVSYLSDNSTSIANILNLR